MQTVADYQSFEGDPDDGDAGALASGREAFAAEMPRVVGTIETILGRRAAADGSAGGVARG